jgi:hypothetical protein
MSDVRTLPREMAIARAAVELMKHRHLGEEDPDFFEMLENETDALEILRSIIRRARLDDADSEATKAIETQLRERRTRLAERADKARSVVLHAMQDMGLEKLPMPDATVSVRAGRPSVEITDLSRLPERFVRVKVEADKSAIGEALKQGEAIPGAMLSNAAPSLSIRTR